MNDQRQEEQQQRATKEKDAAYTTWMEKPETKLMISLLPPLTTDTQRECFETLVRAGYDAGHVAGSTATAQTLLRTMLEFETRGERPRR